MTTAQQTPTLQMSYIGRKPCGCIVMAVADADPKIVAEMVHDMMAEGLTIEHVPDDYVCTHFGPCRCEAQRELDEWDLEGRGAGL